MVLRYGGSIYSDKGGYGKDALCIHNRGREYLCLKLWISLLEMYKYRLNSSLSREFDKIMKNHGTWNFL